MPDSADPPAPPPRTWRPIAAWTAGILLVLGLVWLVGAVVVPVWQVRRVVQQTWGLTPGEYRTALKELGGPTVAARNLAFYLRLPPGIAPNRHVAAYLLSECGDAATPALAALTRDDDRWVRLHATMGLADRGDPRALQPLFDLLRDPDNREPAADGLGKLGPAAKSAIPALEALLKDEDANVRFAAIEALKKIKGEESGK